MKFILDVVIPVSMPTQHLGEMQTHLSKFGQGIRINYVLDYRHESVILDTPNFVDQSNKRFFQGHFGSPGRARNYAIEHSDAPFICFWDVDDIPVATEALCFVKELMNSKRDIGIGNWAYVDKPDIRQGISPYKVGTSPGIWRFFFSRQFMDSVRFTDFKWGEDQLFLGEIFAKDPRFLTTEQIVYRYAKHVPGALTTKNENVLDLVEVTKQAIPILRSIIGVARVCFEIMIWRQIYTTFKFGGIRLGLTSFCVTLARSHFRILTLGPVSHFLKRGRSNGEFKSF